ncbi:hypothetical protein HYO45_13160 [Vibrio parahaemolyticus]|nr:hypothetical protein [Vibrio parahaemolyticus]
MPPVVAAVGAIVATLGVAGTIALGVSLVAAGVAYSAYRDAKKARSAGRSTASQKQMFRSAAAPKNLVLGHAITSGPMHAAAEEGTPNDEGIGETLHILVHIAGHPCEDVTHCWMNDEALLRNATEDPNKLSFTHQNGAGTVYVYLGNQTSQLSSLNGTPLAGGDGEDEMIGQGDTIAHVVMKSDPEKWPAGLPNIKFAVKGVKVYDPRIDDTVWTDNPALLLRWYRTALKHGHPIDDSYIAAANICDELVDTPGASREKRYRCNYAFPCNESPRTVMSNIRASCAGKSLSLIGRHGLTVGAYYGGATTTLTPADIVGDITTQADVRRRDRYNTVTATYLDPESNWNEVDMPQFRHDGYYALDGEYEIVDDLNLECVPSAYQAQRLAAIHLLTTREGAKLEIPCNLRGFELLPGKTFKLNFPENGWTDVEFMVESWKFVHEKGVTLSVRQHLASNYEFNGDTAKVPARPSLPTLNDPTQVEGVTHLSYRELVDDNVAQVLITWEHQSFGGITYEVKIYQGETLLCHEETKQKHYRLTDGYTVGTYRVEVVAINGYGARSLNASLVFDIRPPVMPKGCDVDVSNWSISMTPIAGAQTTFDTLFDFAFGFAADEPDLIAHKKGRGRSLAMQNLTPDTQYHFAVREVSRWGESDWWRGKATTLKKSDDILDVIDGEIGQNHLDDALNDFLAEVDRVGHDNTSAIDEVKGNLLAVGEGLGGLDREAQDISKELFYLTGSVANLTDEYERRLLEGETLVDEVVYRDPETGRIINKATAYTDQAQTSAMIAIDGVAAEVEITAQKIAQVETETGKRLSEAESAILVNAGQISLKASYSEVTEMVAGALDALTPAYSWQFNTGDDGWDGGVWDQHSAITGTAFSRSSILFNANDNPVVRLCLKAEANGTLSWNGGQQQILIPHPGVQDAFETVVLTLTADDGWSGSVTSLHIEMDATIDSIEVGKPSATELQLQDIAYRMTNIEQELDAENARWGVYLTQDYWDTHALTLTDVSQEIDGWDAKWKVSATLKEFDSNQTLSKANQAAQWINASESNITSVVIDFNAKPGGIDESLARSNSRLNTAEQQIDAALGEIRQTVTSVSNVESLLGSTDSIDDLLDAYNAFLQQGEFAEQQVSLGYSQNTLESHADELGAQAQSMLELYATQGHHEAAIKRTERSIASGNSALAEVKEELEAKVEQGDSESYARATQYTKTAVGYCIDAHGRLTNEDDAVACVAAGHSWVEGPLAEFVRNLQIKNASGQQASISQMMQTFEKSDGGLVVRGGMIANNNGKISGFVNTNDGQFSSMDFIQDHFRVGYQDEDGNFVPIQYIDTESGKMVFNGRLILDDGKVISSTEQLKGDDGSPGNAWGTLVLRNGVFPSDEVATNDFRSRYKRSPVLDDMLTYVSNDGAVSSVKTFDGTQWVSPGLRLNGNIITKDSIYGDRFVAGSEIRSPVFEGGSGYFSDVVRIGEVSGHSVFINGAATQGTDKVLRAGIGSKATFYLLANGFIHSEAGGYLDNLTIGTNCRVLGKISASQIEGTKEQIAKGSVSLAGVGNKYGGASKTGEVNTHYKAAAWGDPSKTYVIELAISGGMNMDPLSSVPDNCFWEYEVTGQRVRVYWSNTPATLWFSWKMQFNHVEGAHDASLDWTLYQII